MTELEEEIEKYHSERDSNKYINIQTRLIHTTKENKQLQPTRQANLDLKNQYNKRLAQLWTEFENRSDSLVEVLEKQVGGGQGESGIRTNSQKNFQLRKDAIDKYREEITKIVINFLQQFSDKFEDNKELSSFAVWVVGSKVLDLEVNMFTKKNAPWSTFQVTSKTEQQVEAYLKTKMSKYIKGEVYKR